MTSWELYCQTHVGPDGRHLEYPLWRKADVWTFQRDDGLVTAHKSEAPYSLWLETVEASMKLADRHITLGADLPEGMRTVRTVP